MSSWGKFKHKKLIQFSKKEKKQNNKSCIENINKKLKVWSIFWVTKMRCHHAQKKRNEISFMLNRCVAQTCWTARWVRSVTCTVLLTLMLHGLLFQQEKLGWTHLYFFKHLKWTNWNALELRDDEEKFLNWCFICE